MGIFSKNYENILIVLQILKLNKLGLSCAKLSKLKLDTHQLPARVLIMSWKINFPGWVLGIAKIKPT